MAQINDCIRKVIGGDEGQFNDFLLKWYQGQGATSDDINDAEYEMLVLAGATPGPINDMWVEMFHNAGYQGTLDDMQYHFWCIDEGNLGPTLFDITWDQDGLNVDNMYDASCTLTYVAPYEGGTWEFEVTHPDTEITIERSGDLDNLGTIAIENLDCSIFPDGILTASARLTVLGDTGPWRRDNISKFIGEYVRQTIATAGTGGILTGWLDYRAMPETQAAYAHVDTPTPKEFLIGNYDGVEEYFIVPVEHYTQFLCDGLGPGNQEGWGYFRERDDNTPLRFTLENVPEGSVAQVVGTGYYLSAELVATDYWIRTDVVSDPSDTRIIIFGYQPIPPEGYDFTWTTDPIDEVNQYEAEVAVTGALPGSDYSFTVTGDGTPMVVEGVVPSPSFSIADMDVSGLADGELTGTLVLTNEGGPGVDVEHPVTKFTVVIPSGYTIDWDDDFIDRENEADTSLTVADAEIDATWDFSAYNILTPEISIDRAGTVLSTTFPIANLDVSSLEDGTIVGELTLTNAAGAGDPDLDYIGKDTTIYPPSGYDFDWGVPTVNPGNETSVPVNITGASTIDNAQYTFITTGDGDDVVETGPVELENFTINTDLSGFGDGTLNGSLVLVNDGGSGDVVGPKSIEKDTLLPPSGYDFSWDQDPIGPGQEVTSWTVTDSAEADTYRYEVTGSGSTPVTGSGPAPDGSFPITGIDTTAFDDGTLSGSLWLENAAGEGDEVTHTAEKKVVPDPPEGYTFQWLDISITPDNETAVASQIASAEVGADYLFTVSGPGDVDQVFPGTVTTPTQPLPDVDCSGYDDSPPPVNGSVILSNAGGGGPLSSADITKLTDIQPPSGYTCEWRVDSIPVLQFDGGVGNADNIVLVVSGLEVGWTYTINASQGGPIPIVPPSYSGTVDGTTMLFGFNCLDGAIGPVTATVQCSNEAGPGGIVTPTVANQKVWTWVTIGAGTGVNYSCTGTGDPDWFFPDGTRFRGNDPGVRTWNEANNSCYVGFWNPAGVTGVLTPNIEAIHASVELTANLPACEVVDISFGTHVNITLSHFATTVKEIYIDDTLVSGDLSKLQTHPLFRALHASACASLTGTISDFSFAASTLTAWVVMSIGMSSAELNMMIDAAWTHRTTFPGTAFHFGQGIEPDIRIYDKCSGEGFTYGDGLVSYNGTTFTLDWNPDSERCFNGDFYQGAVGQYPLHHEAHGAPTLPGNEVIWHEDDKSWQILKIDQADANFGVQQNNINPAFGAEHHVALHTTEYFEPNAPVIIQMPDGQRLTVTTGGEHAAVINCAVGGPILLVSGDPGSITNARMALWSCIQIGARQPIVGVNVFPAYIGGS